jgi:hypothetical protein
MARSLGVGDQWCGSKVVHRFGKCNNFRDAVLFIQLAVIFIDRGRCPLLAHAMQQTACQLQWIVFKGICAP